MCRSKTPVAQSAVSGSAPKKDEAKPIPGVQKKKAWWSQPGRYTLPRVSMRSVCGVDQRAVQMTHFRTTTVPRGFWSGPIHSHCCVRCRDKAPTPFAELTPSMLECAGTRRRPRSWSRSAR